MTTTRPEPSLADVIRRSTDARGYWLTPDTAELVAAAVAAHLASDAVIERMAIRFASIPEIPMEEAEQFWRDLDEDSRHELRRETRAAVAAVVGEDV